MAAVVANFVNLGGIILAEMNPSVLHVLQDFTPEGLFVSSAAKVGIRLQQQRPMKPLAQRAKLASTAHLQA